MSSNFVCSHCGVYHSIGRHQLGEKCWVLRDCPGVLIYAVKGRAHTHTEKKLVIESILKSWLKHPQLRLGQFIECCLSSRKSDSPNLFNIEDEVLADLAQEFSNKG